MHELFIVGKAAWRNVNTDTVFVRGSSDRSDTTAHQEHPLFVEPTTTDTRYFTAQDQHLFSSNVLNVARMAVNTTKRTDDFVATVDIPKSMFFTEDPHFGSITIQSGVSGVGSTGPTPRG